MSIFAFKEIVTVCPLRAVFAACRCSLLMLLFVGGWVVKGGGVVVVVVVVLVHVSELGIAAFEARGGDDGVREMGGGGWGWVKECSFCY